MFRTIRYPLAYVVCLYLGQATFAARIIDAEIALFEGRIVMAGTRDDGKADPATVWSYLKKVTFGDGRSLQIRPDKDNPLQATLKGKIKVRMDYGGEAETTKLRLIRSRETDSSWKIHPDDVDELAKPRKSR